MTTPRIHLCGQELDRPGHICAFFDSRSDAYDTVVPFLKDGIDRGEEVVSVVDAVKFPDHIARLDAGGVRGDGRMALATSEETYLSGGRFDMNRMTMFVTRKLEEARARGRRVRTAGWMDWIHREMPGTERAFEYEAQMNLLFPQYDATFMCVYDMAKLDGQMVVDVLATHPWVILNGSIRENSFYVPPDVYLKEIVASH